MHYQFTNKQRQAKYRVIMKRRIRKAGWKFEGLNELPTETLEKLYEFTKTTSLNGLKSELGT